MNKKFVIIISLIMMPLINGCGAHGGMDAIKAGQAQKIPAGNGRMPPVTQSNSRTSSVQVSEATVDDLDNPTGLLAQRVIYFAYDSDDVLPEYQPIVRAHAEYLSAHASQRAVLEGHADERGSSEYNVALGERRARSVERNMRLQGAGDGQLDVVSYGEEKPSQTGHEESVWEKNRRVEIVYSGH